MSYHAEKPLIPFIIHTSLVWPTAFHFSHVSDRYLYNFFFGINDCLVDYILTKIRIIEEDELLPAVLCHHLHDDLIEIDRWADH